MAKKAKEGERKREEERERERERERDLLSVEDNPLCFVGQGKSGWRAVVLGLSVTVLSAASD